MCEQYITMSGGIAHTFMVTKSVSVALDLYFGCVRRSGSFSRLSPLES
jgi:hypothetical protein